MASTPDVKIANRTLVYKQLWTDHTDSIAELSKATGISLPTVTANINELAADGLIRTVGQQESTGGRKANLYELVADARTAIGVEVFADHSYICLIYHLSAHRCNEPTDSSCAHDSPMVN